VIEANDNIDEVTMRRQGELRRAQESYQRAVSEGRLDVRPRVQQQAQLVVAPPPAVPGAPRQEEAVAATATVPAEAPPVNPEAAWRYTRLAITAGLVLLLFVVWTWQKRAGR
jgi:hypothetical protein